MDPFAGVLSIPATRHPYAYGFDSPLLYTDPSGEIAPWLLAIGVGAGIGAIGGGVSYVLRNPGRPVAEYAHERAFWQTVGVGFASGAVAGAVGWAVPALLPTSSLLGAMGVGALSGSLAAGVGQVTTNLLMGCDPHSGLAFAMISGGVTGGLAGGAGYAVRVLRGQRPAVLTGQRHHPFTKKIMRELEQHETLRGIFQRDDLLVQASTLADQQGYQTWHRELDYKVVRWLQENGKAGVGGFGEYLTGVYGSLDLATRFPTAVGEIAAYFARKVAGGAP